MSRAWKIARPLLVGGLAGVAVALLFSRGLPPVIANLVDDVEHVSYYLRCRIFFGQVTAEQRQRLSEEIPDVCIVDIDDRSMARLGNYWGWNRGYHARMLRNLANHYPGAIGFDIMFDSPEDSKHIKRFDAVLERASASGALSEELRRLILSSVDYDQQLVDATRAAGVVFHAVRMSDSSDYAGQMSAIAYRTTPQWHAAMGEGSAISLPVDPLDRGIQSKPVLDGCFPMLARASWAVGHVNVPPSEDGVVREVPLLYRFGTTKAVYLPLSVRICASLFGTPAQEISYEPGRWLDIGTPFKILRDEQGELRCSYPGLRPRQIALLQEHAREILGCRRGQVDIMTFAALESDSAGRAVLRMYAGRIRQPALGALLTADFAAVKSLPEGEGVDLAPEVRLVKEAEGSYTFAAGPDTCYFGDADLTTLAAVAGEPEILTPPVTPRLLYYPFSVRSQHGEIVSSIPVLRGRVLREVLKTPWARIESLGKGQRLEFGERRRIPLTPRNTHIVTYFGPGNQTFVKYSYSAIYGDEVAGQLPARIFLVGSSAPGLFDFVPAPVDKKYPGVEVHASLIRSFLTNTFVHRLPPWADLVIVLLMGVAIGVTALAFAPLPGGLLAALLVVAYAFVSLFIFSATRLWIEMARPLLTAIVSYAAVMAYRYMTEERNRKFLHETFNQYLPPQVIDRMYRERVFPKLGGDEAVLTAFFTDIQGFSTFSEKLGSPTRLVDLLNEYLTAMTDILFAHGGTLDKYEGDAIIAFFGAPEPMTDHAFKACATALAMQRKLDELRRKWAGEGERWPPIVHAMRMRIGINTGPIVYGNMGSSVRKNYTMMGDAVNLAARLESAAKQYGVYTMISDATYTAAGKAFEVRQLDKIQVVGKSEPVVVYELLAEKGALSADLKALVARYNEGLALYYAREWERAEAVLAETEAMEPLRAVAPGGMSPSRRLLEECRRNRANPPGPEWDGVTRLTMK